MNPDLDVSFNEYCESHLLFITMKKRESGKIDSPEGVAKQLEAFSKFHFNICKRVLGQRVDEWKGNEPLSYAFVDFSGTRYGLGTKVFPHIHAIMMLPGNLNDRYWSFVSEDAFRMKMLIKLDLSELNIQRFDSSRGSVENLISYCAKGVVGEGGKHSDKTFYWDIYPKGGR
ncbi:hypothetical protein [Labrys neptuniae]